MAARPGLERFRDIHQDRLEKLGQQLQQQRSQSERYAHNAQQLQTIYDECQVSGGESAFAWHNRHQLRGNLQHLEKLQQQHLALAEAEQRRLQHTLMQQNVKVKSLDTVLDKRKKAAQLRVSKAEQKLNDEIGAQRYFHRK
ncbi:flagellar export protein FliJ [Vibrio sp. WXL210]|uniref:flagellar export protein FliJ n=1 Tax=Vibrio sp. WXL210 TaxID=3450709 RepID=UPI003EC64CF1